MGIWVSIWVSRTALLWPSPAHLVLDISKQLYRLHTYPGVELLDPGWTDVYLQKLSLSSYLNSLILSAFFLWILGVYVLDVNHFLLKMPAPSYGLLLYSQYLFMSSSLFLSIFLYGILKNLFNKFSFYQS